MTTKTKELNIAEQLFMNQNLSLSGDNGLILPQSLGRDDQTIKNNIREQLKDVSFKPLYLHPVFNYAGVGSFIISLMLTIASLVAASPIPCLIFSITTIVLIMFVFGLAPKSELDSQETEQLNEAARFNPRVARYLLGLEKDGQLPLRKHYKYLNIEQQTKIIHGEYCKQRMREIASVVPQEKSLHIQETLQRFQVGEFFKYNSRNKRWYIMKAINMTVFMGLVMFVVAFNLADIETTKTMLKVVDLSCAVTLLYLLLSSLFIMFDREYGQDFVYNEVIYHNLYTISQYNPAVVEYVKKALEEDRLLTQEDLSRLKHSQQIKRINYVKDMLSLKQRQG